MKRAIDLQASRDAGMRLLIGFKGLEFEDELKVLMKEYKIGGIVLFRRNIESPDQLRELLHKAREFSERTFGFPLQIAIDQEGGPVQRLIPPFTQLPSAQELSREGADAVIQWTIQSAKQLRELGISINLAPVLDVAPEEESHFMAARSLGTEPKRVAELGRLWIETLQKNGVSATAKHYPGLGRAALDPHHYAPVIKHEDELALEKDLVPFRAAIEAGAHCVMTSHALYPFLDARWPATLSPEINHVRLRNRLGFEGVLLSDDMDMAAVSEKYGWSDMVRQGLLSSIDFFLLCQKVENIEPFYRSLRDALSGPSPFADAAHKSARRIERLCGLQSLALSERLWEREA